MVAAKVEHMIETHYLPKLPSKLDWLGALAFCGGVHDYGHSFPLAAENGHRVRRGDGIIKLRVDGEWRYYIAEISTDKVLLDGKVAHSASLSNLPNFAGSSIDGPGEALRMLASFVDSAREPVCPYDDDSIRDTWEQARRMWA